MALNPPIEAIPLQETNREEHIQRFLTSLPRYGSSQGFQQDQEVVWKSGKSEGQEKGREAQQPSMVLETVHDPPQEAYPVGERETEAAQRRLERKHRRREKAAILKPKPPTPPIPRVKQEPAPKPNAHEELDDEWWDEHRRQKRAALEIPSSTTRRPMREQEHSSSSDVGQRMSRVKVKIKASGKAGQGKDKDKRAREPKGRIPGMDIIENYKPFTTALAPRLTLKPMNSKKGMFANGKSSDPAVIRHITGMDEGIKKLIGSHSSGPSKRVTLHSSPSREQEEKDWRDQWRRKGLKTGGGALPPTGHTNSASWPSTLPSSDGSVKMDRDGRQATLAPGNGGDRASTIRTVEELRGRYMYNQGGAVQQRQLQASIQVNRPDSAYHQAVEENSEPIHPQAYDERRQDSQPFFEAVGNTQHQYHAHAQPCDSNPTYQTQLYHLDARDYRQDAYVDPAPNHLQYHHPQHLQDGILHPDMIYVDSHQAYTYPQHHHLDGNHDDGGQFFQAQGASQADRIGSSGDFWKTSRPLSRYPVTPLPSNLEPQRERTSLWPQSQPPAQAEILETYPHPYPNEMTISPSTHPYPYPYQMIDQPPPGHQEQYRAHQPHFQHWSRRPDMGSQPYAQSFPSEAYVTPTPIPLARPFLAPLYEGGSHAQQSYLEQGQTHDTAHYGNPHSNQGAYITNLPSPLSLSLGIDQNQVPQDDLGMPQDWHSGEARDTGITQGQEVAEYGATTDEWKNLWSSRKAYR